MIDGFTDAQIIGGLFALLVASYAAFFAWLVRRFDRVEAKIDALTIAVSRLEGAVYHGLPEPRRAVSEQ